METLKWKQNQSARQHHQKTATAWLSEQEVQKAWDFHRRFDVYSVTPLRNLAHLARFLGVSGIYVKDESYRFGLNAFKVLGGAYAIGRYLAERLGTDIAELSFDLLRSEHFKRQLGELTFTTATDGNHGRGVAWAAQQLGQKAVVFMPKGSAAARLQQIIATGAEGYITDLNYDDTVRLAAEKAKRNGWVLVQDTAWAGYADIPSWIMQGYATIAAESLQQLRELGVEKPTHIFLQAGVGSFAAAIQGFFTSLFAESRPLTVIVEPNKAECLYLSALAGDGKPRKVDGDLNTIMAGLACGEPNPIAWEILRDYSDLFISCPDHLAALGMRILGNPLGDDPRVVSGESGAVTTGIVSAIMRDERLKELRDALQLNADSRILLINTEGDTDPQHYRKVVWDGLYPNVCD
nr:diaminopropionate ammonia-lyase [Brevibacillus marinus]